MRTSNLRIGVIVPSSNTTIEPELTRRVPTGVTVHATRVYQEETTVAKRKVSTVLAMNSQLSAAVRMLQSMEPGIIAFGCTAASFLSGTEQDRAICADLSDLAGVPVITTSTAVSLAIRALGVSTLAMGTPYIEEVNRREIEYLQESAGVEVVNHIGLDIVGNLPKGRLSPSVVEDVARRVDHPTAEAIFLSCTNWPTMDLIDRLERDLQKPVITSNQATLWACLRLASVDDVIGGVGRLFHLAARDREVNTAVLRTAN